MQPCAVATRRATWTVGEGQRCSSARSFGDTDWDRIVSLYVALEHRWPSPSVHVARLVATAHGCIARGLTTSEVERELRALEAGPAAYASRDAALALADIAWRTDRRPEAAALYRDLAEVMQAEPLRRFCLRRAAAGDHPSETG